MSENSFMSKETDQNGLPTKDKSEGEATMALKNLSEGSKLGENTHDAVKKDSCSDSKDRSRSRKNRSRSRSRHRSRDRRGSRSRDQRSRRSRSRRRSRSYSKEHKWRSPDKKRRQSRSPDKKNSDKIIESKSPSPEKNSKHRQYESESSRKRRRSRERDQRYTRSPDIKHGNNSDRNLEDSRSRYTDRRTRFSDNRSTTRDRRNEDKQFNNNNSWSRGLNQTNWDDKSQHLTSTFDDVIGKSVQKIRKEFDDGSHFHNDNPSSNSSIPVLLSSNCKSNNPAFAALNTNMVRPSMQSGADGRFPPPLMAAPTTNFKDGLPNIREPPPGFIPFRHNNPIRLQAEPAFTLLDRTRLPLRNAEPQQVLLQQLQMIRTPSKMEMPVDLRFLSSDLRLPLYSTGIVNRQQTNLITRVPLDQAQVMHQVQPRLVGISQVTDIPPPPPPPQTFTITQTQSVPPNAPFPASGVQRLPENVSFVSNPPPQLIYGSLGSRPGFITNITVNEPLQPRIPSSHPPQQVILSDLHSHISSTAVLGMQKSGMATLLPAHSTADITDLKASVSKNNKSKAKNTGSEKYSPYSCSSEGSSNDAYSDALFEDPFNDIGTPLEEESNSVEPQGSPKHMSGLPHLQDVNHKVHGKSDKDKDTLVHPFVDISGIAKKLDLTNTLNMIQVNDLKKVLETANSVAKVKQNETSDAKLLKAQKIEQIAEEVKMALKPHFSKNLITKDEYKDIMRRAVPKIFGSRSSLDSKRIQAFVQEYVNKITKSRKPGKVKNTTAHGANHDKKHSSKIPSKA